MIQAFQTYQRSGLACLPTKPDKSPDVKGTWKGGVTSGYDTAHGIGIICGELSGGLECLDFDNHFGDAKENLSAFLTGEVKAIYEKYDLPIESTLTGGFHLLYRCRKIEGNQKLASRPKQQGNRWVPDAIIETRGEGGYFVAAPTEGYKVIRNSLNDIREITPEERDLLIETAKSFNTWHEVVKHEYEQRDRPGDVYNSKHESIDEMRGALQRAGWYEVGDQKWRRPGKDNGISATLGKAAENIFYNFSPNSYPFEQGKGYTAFQVVGLLDYNGDFAKFATDLSDRYKLNERQTNKKKPVEKAPDELERVLTESFIDLDIPVEKPPVVMKVRNNYGSYSKDSRLFTLGNFSAITGKSKSKKTFLATMMLASAVGNSIIGDKFVSEFPDNKRAVLLFDTEQSRYDAYVSANRITRLLGYTPEHFGAFDLREFSPLERCQIIEYALDKYKQYLGFVVIDGIADLAKAINEEDEATRVVGLLMRWTKVYNCHVVTIIHQNKNDNYATGHLGSSILKKSECVISVEKDQAEVSKSNVSCDLIRGAADFNDFSFSINDDGLPIVEKSYFNEREF